MEKSPEVFCPSGEAQAVGVPAKMPTGGWQDSGVPFSSRTSSGAASSGGRSEVRDFIRSGPEFAHGGDSVGQETYTYKGGRTQLGNDDRDSREYNPKDGRSACASRRRRT